MISFCRDEISIGPAGTDLTSTITWGNEFSLLQGGTGFHLVFV